MIVDIFTLIDAEANNDERNNFYYIVKECEKVIFTYYDIFVVFSFYRFLVVFDRSNPDRASGNRNPPGCGNSQESKFSNKIYQSEDQTLVCIYVYMCVRVFMYMFIYLILICESY